MRISKKLIKFLTVSSALLMLAGVGAGTNNINVNARHRRTHRVYRRSTWHKGAPAILKHNSQWLSTPVKISNGFRAHYMRTETPMGGHYGFNPTPFYFKRNKRFDSNGADAGAGMAVNAHYKVLGYHKYEVKSGTPGDYIYATVKVHNFNHISIWSGGQYFGYFHRMSNRAIHHFIYHSYF